jgi:hypothetical protein
VTWCSRAPADGTPAGLSHTQALALVGLHLDTATVGLMPPPAPSGAPDAGHMLDSGVVQGPAPQGNSVERGQPMQSGAVRAFTVIGLRSDVA